MQEHWTRPLTIPPLREDTVQLWRLELGAPGATRVLANAAAVLSAAEQERGERILAASARTEFVGARTLLRILLGDLLGVPPVDVRLAATEAGKPYLAGSSSLRFNVSHSDGLVLIALTRRAAVGVDVESSHAGAIGPEELLELASAHFSAKECRVLARIPPGRGRVDAFLEVWTRREAVSKADGRGISSPFSLGALRGQAGGAAGEQAFTLRRAGVYGESTWHVRSVGVGLRHHAALALERSGLRLFCMHTEGLFG